MPGEHRGAGGASRVGATGAPRCYTLQELAAATGMTVRNVRSYQTRGLIPPPGRRGRQSVYGPEHLDRLLEIREARTRGATLGLIGTHLARGGTLDGRTVERTWLPGAAATGSGRTASLDGLLARSGDRAARQVDQLVSAGVIRRTGRRVVADRELVTPVAALARRGVPAEDSLAVAQAALQAGRLLAEAFGPVLADHPGDERVRADLYGLASAVLARAVTVDRVDLSAAEQEAQARIVSR